jgi:hypothetical protein
MNANSLSERAMLVSLIIRRWQAALTDRKITREVAKKHDVKEKRAGKFRKNAIDTEAASFKGVITAASELRDKHYFYTLPWSQDGARILPAAMFEEYSQETRALKAAYEKAVKVFLADYPLLKAAARIEMNGMYDETDYPVNIAAKFSVDVVVMPLPNEEDFRVSLPDSAIAEIRQGIHAEVSKTLEMAMRDPYKRLYEHVSRMVKRLSDPEAVFRDTLVTGLAELCTVLPGLNVTNDPHLDDLRLRAERMIQNVSPQDLRDRPAIRRHVASKAEEIQQLMAGYMGAAPAEEEAA